MHSGVQERLRAGTPTLLYGVPKLMHSGVQARLRAGTPILYSMVYQN